MKFSPRTWAAAGSVLIACWAARAELGEWVQRLDTAAKLEQVFFKTVGLPSGAVASRRPPSETIPELTRAVAAEPARAALRYLRANERESNLDFAGAEADWRAWAATGTPRFDARMALADFYHRRLQPAKEIAALLEAARLQGDLVERSAPAAEQRAWKAFERAAELVSAQVLPQTTGATVFNAWLARYPKEPAAYENAFAALVAAKDWSAAESVAARYAQSFPNEKSFPVLARAMLAEVRGSAADAAALYEREWDPRWPAGLVKAQFDLLQRTRTLHTWLAATRNAIVAHPADLRPAVRLFYYFQQRGDLPHAWRALLELRARRRAANQAWTAEELVTAARLFEATNNPVEAARHYVEAYELDRSTGAAAEEALAGLANILQASAEQPIPYGSGDLTYYRDIATMDRHPGALNGILSLILNTTGPEYEFDLQQQSATAYFHRAKAAELVAEFDARFPNSTRRPALNALVIEAYAKHGEDAAVVKKGTEFLARFPGVPQRVDVALAVADAHARLKQEKEEFAIYDALLKELSARASGVPIGRSGRVKATEPAPLPDEQDADSGVNAVPVPAMIQPAQAGAAQNTYSRVLDRYVGRLAAARRLTEALAVFRREIDRNPNDPGIYERLASFLQQNRLDARIAETYRLAAKKFANDPSWYGKLARWHLRRKETAAFGKLTQEVVAIFSGSNLEQYFREVVPVGSVGRALYIQLNKYALERFPHDLVFIKNLISAYEGGADPQSFETLLRNNWYYDSALRQQFFQYLASRGRLRHELTALASLAPDARADRAAEQFLAEGYAWQGHFEEAEAPMESVSARYPGETALAGRSAAIHRSLGNPEAAVRATERMARMQPTESRPLTTIGEIWADRSQFAKAKPYWDRIPALQPGKPDGYLEAATVYWDYYRFDDALRLIGEGRSKLTSPALFSYEAGAIREGKRVWDQAISEYLSGALNGDSRSQQRLLTLAERQAFRQRIEQAIVAADTNGSAFAVRVALLEQQRRRDDLSAYLSGLISNTTSPEMLARIGTVAERQGLDAVRAAEIRREVEITKDPIERMRLRLALVRFHESHNDLREAAAEMDALLRDTPASLGVVRAATDFAWRNKQAARAVDILQAAAGRANPSLRRQFLVEAARKSNESGDYARARTIVGPLLAAEPVAEDLIALEADSYARAGDDAGLRTFYTAKIGEVKDPGARARLRRTLIPVLTSQKDYQGAIGQYMEVLNQFPDDRALIGEVASYAREHNLAAQVAAYYGKAAQASPRDARWPALLARLSAEFEDTRGAVEWYRRASAIRPERQDFVLERAELHERLLDWEAAAAAYARMYELAYHDPQWMAKVAEERARQGRRADAVQALRTAFLDGRPARAEDYFEVARLLEGWGIVAEAAGFAEDGLDKLDPESRDVAQNVQTYARIAARRREVAAAAPKLAKFDEPVAEAAWLAAAAIVHDFYTPEEKQTFAALAEQQAPRRPSIAIAAGLSDVAARWMTPNELAGFEQSRMRFAQAAQVLERLANKESASFISRMGQAAENYRLAGLPREELRVFATMEQSGNEMGRYAERYAELLRRTEPARLVEIARAGNSDLVRNTAAQIAIKGTNADLALRAVEARSAGMPPVWGHAYTALTGLYFARTAAPIFAAFDGVLGPRTISGQLAARADRDQQVVGDDWFYYGARYGEFLALARRDRSEDYVVAELEGRPASSSSYVVLADWYRTNSAPARALIEYGRALQLSPERADAHYRMAEVYAATGERAKALDAWRAAIRALSAMQDRRLVPEEFWTGLRDTIAGIGNGNATVELRGDLDTLVSTYVRRNGLFRIREVVEPLLAGTPGAAGWVATLSRSARDPIEFLAGITEEQWFPQSSRATLLARAVELAEADTARQFGEGRRSAEYRLRDLRLKLVSALVESGEYARAAEALGKLSAEDKRAMRGDRLTPLELSIAAGLGTVEPVLAQYRDEPEGAPGPRELLDAGAALRRSGKQEAARRVLEFVYTSALARREFAAANFLGLAEVRLESGDSAGAVEALRRMMTVGERPFDALVSAAELLERFGKGAEAREFWRARVAAAPWDAAAGAALAKSKSDSAALRRIASSPDAAYAARATAAQAIGGPASLGSAELDALASGNMASTVVERPYFYYARLRAAAATRDGAAKLALLRGALEIDPAANDTRMALFRAAIAADRSLEAAGAMYSIDDYGEIAMRTEDSWIPQWQMNAFARKFAANDTDRARIAFDLASVYRRLGNDGAAVWLLRVARSLDSTLPVAREIATISAEIEVRKENANRMPVIASGTSQPHRVRLQIAVAQGGGR